MYKKNNKTPLYCTATCIRCLSIFIGRGVVIKVDKTSWPHSISLRRLYDRSSCSFNVSLYAAIVFSLFLSRSVLFPSLFISLCSDLFFSFSIFKIMLTFIVEQILFAIQMHSPKKLQNK